MQDESLNHTKILSSIDRLAEIEAENRLKKLVEPDLLQSRDRIRNR